MPFEFDGKAEVKNINIRNGASDDSHVSLDIKLHIGGVPSTSAASALGADNPADIDAALFRSLSEDSERTARFLGLKGLTSSAKWEGKHAVTFKGLRRVRAHSVGKITLLPRAAGKFDCTCSIVVQDPPSGYLDTLKEFLNREIGVKLEHDSELPLAGGEAKAPNKSATTTRGEKAAASRDVKKALGARTRPRAKKKAKAA